jgi:hypothetical protein
VLCCKKRQKKKKDLKFREEMYEIAKAKLYTEIDIGEMIKNARIGRFVSKLML